MTLAAAVLALANLLPQDVGRAVGAEERDALFALLDRFDALDTSKLPFVRVATGEGVRHGNEPPRNTYRHGFLLGAQGREFRVRYLELDSAVLTSTSAGTPEDLRIGFEPVDLRTFAAELIDRLNRGDDILSGDFHYCRRLTPMEPSTCALLAARACLRCGHEAEAGRLLQAVAREHPNKPLASTWHLESDLAAHLVLAPSAPTVSWADLLAKHDAWLEVFSEDEKRPVVSKRRQALLRIVEQRRTHAPQGEPPTDTELLEDLRDQLLPRDSGGFGDWPASPPEPSPPHAQRAMDLLVERGLAAAPALIAALTDETPTRSVFYCSRYGGWFETRTLGELAGDVLTAIAGEREQDWQQWYETASRTSLRESVRAALQAGGRDSVSAWLRRWPDDLDPVFECANQAGGWKEYFMLDTAARSALPAVHARALQVLREAAARDDEMRGSMCALLQQHGDPSGYRSLVDDWRADRLPADVLADQLPAILGAGVEGTWPVLLARFEQDDVRAAFVSALSRTARDQILWHVPAGDRGALDRDLRICLVRLLGDATHFADGVTLVSGHRRFQLHRATRADVAAATLWAWWPDEFQFDPAATARVRARRIALLREKATGIAAPASRQVAKVDASSPNLVRSVTFDPSAAALPASAKEPLVALQGTSPDEKVLIEKLFAIARTDACAGRTVVLHFERDGDGTGATLRWELVESECDWDFRATVGAVSVRSGCSWGRWGRDTARPAILHESDIERVRHALGSPSTCGVEVLMAVRAPE